MENYLGTYLFVKEFQMESKIDAEAGGSISPSRSVMIRYDFITIDRLPVIYYKGIRIQSTIKHTSYKKSSILHELEQAIKKKVIEKSKTKENQRSNFHGSQDKRKSQGRPSHEQTGLVVALYNVLIFLINHNSMVLPFLGALVIGPGFDAIFAPT